MDATNQPNLQFNPSLIYTDNVLFWHDSSYPISTQENLEYAFVNTLQQNIVFKQNVVIPSTHVLPNSINKTGDFYYDIDTKKFFYDCNQIQFKPEQKNPTLELISNDVRNTEISPVNLKTNDVSMNSTKMIQIELESNDIESTNENQNRPPTLNQSRQKSKKRNVTETKKSTLDIIGGISCNICKTICVNKPAFDTHYRTEHDAEYIVYMCVLCQKETDDYHLFHSHCYKHIMASTFKCEQCNKVLSDRRRLQHHIQAFHKGDFKCSAPSCQLWFTTAKHLSTHEATHKNSTQLTCQKCLKTFLSVTDCQSHIDAHSNIKYPCPFCEKSDLNKELLSSHISAHFIEDNSNESTKSSISDCKSTTLQSVGGIRCGVCEAVHESRKAHIAHYRSEHEFEEIWYSCSLCRDSFEAYNQLRDHCYRHHIRSYKCVECDKKCPSQRELMIHVEMSHTAPGATAKPFKCAHCKFHFVWEGNFRKHMTKCHGDVSYQCDVCGQLFSTPASLILHEATHKSQSHLICRQCGKLLEDAEQAKAHVDTHKITEYSCPLCTKTYNNKDVLITHLSTHKPTHYICHMCDKSFKDKKQLLQHSKIHSKSKGSSCKFCGKIFSNDLKLQEHLNVHTGQRPYQCDHCPSGFTNHPNLLKHLKRMHTKKRPETAPDKNLEILNPDTLITINNENTIHATKTNEIKVITNEKPTENDLDTIDTKSVSIEINNNNLVEVEEKVKDKEITLDYNSNEDVGNKISIEDKTYPQTSYAKVMNCSYCGEIFTTAFKFMHHINNHSGESTYKCPFCTSSYNKYEYLLQHSRRIHKKGVDQLIFAFNELLKSQEVNSDLVEKDLNIEPCVMSLNDFKCNETNLEILTTNTDLVTRNQTHEHNIEDNINNEAYVVTSMTNKVTYNSEIESIEKEILTSQTSSVDLKNNNHLLTKNIGILEKEILLEFNGIAEMNNNSDSSNASTSTDVINHDFNEIFSHEEFKNKSIVPHNKITSKIYCQYCGKVYSNEYKLEQHINTHTGKRPFECTLCTSTFTSNKNLLDHSRRVHKKGAKELKAIKQTLQNDLENVEFNPLSNENRYKSCDETNKIFLDHRIEGNYEINMQIKDKNFKEMNKTNDKSTEDNTEQATNSEMILNFKHKDKKLKIETEQPINNDSYEENTVSSISDCDLSSTELNTDLEDLCAVLMQEDVLSSDTSESSGSSQLEGTTFDIDEYIEDNLEDLLHGSLHDEIYAFELESSLPPNQVDTCSMSSQLPLEYGPEFPSWPEDILEPPDPSYLPHINPWLTVKGNIYH